MSDIDVESQMTANGESVLDQSIADLKGGRQSKGSFLAVLQTAKLCVPLIRGTSSDRLWVFEVDGMACGGAFTSPSHMPAVGHVERYVNLTGRQVAEQWPLDLTLCINPGSRDVGLLVPGNEVKRMANDGLERVLPAGTGYRVGAPAVDPPPEVRDASASLVAAFPEIDAGYLFQMEDQSNGSRVVLGLALNPDVAPDEFMPKAVRWISETLPRDPGVDMLPLNQELRRTVGEYVPAITATEPY